MSNPRTAPTTVSLTGKGYAVVLLRRVEREWDGLTIRQQAEALVEVDQIIAELDLRTRLSAEANDGSERLSPTEWHARHAVGSLFNR